MRASLRNLELAPLVQGVIRGERLMVARALRCVDDMPAKGRLLASMLHAHRTGAQVLGITGNPGAGKSTVVDGVISLLRAQGKRVGVLAVDPSSPFSGGAILGDRIRMIRHHHDDGVFIRSLATRGSLGGLSRATFDSVRVLDAAGFDVVMVETVGVGQDEVDVARLAETTLVVLVPGMGDDIQAIKAGILEIADVFVINKADKEGVPQLERSLHQMLSLAPDTRDAWEPPIVRTVAAQQEGLEGLMVKVQAHAQFLRGPTGQARLAARHRETFDRLLDAAFIDQARARLASRIEAASQRVQQEGVDPYTEVLNILGEEVS